MRMGMLVLNSVRNTIQAGLEMSQQSIILKVVAVFIIGIVIGVGSSQLYLSVTSPSALPSPSPSLAPSPSLSPVLALDEMYQDAIGEVMVTGQTVTYSGLTPIVEENSDLIWQGESDNKSVLVVAFTKYASSYPVGQTVNTTWGDVWVTLVPDIQTFFQNNVDDNANLTLRAAQLLGLPPNTGNTYFVELWVQPQYLFRPTADSEITDITAQIALPASATTEYKEWFNGNIIYSYYPPRYPWTRLGYTYDWGNPDSQVGLSEFVIKQNALVEVKSVTPTVDYLKP